MLAHLKLCAFEKGRIAAEKHQMRIAPYYELWMVVATKRVDITGTLEIEWLKGYDKQRSGQ